MYGNKAAWDTLHKSDLFSKEIQKMIEDAGITSDLAINNRQEYDKKIKILFSKDSEVERLDILSNKNQKIMQTPIERKFEGILTPEQINELERALNSHVVDSDNNPKSKPSESIKEDFNQLKSDRGLSYGERYVGISFNPNNLPNVDSIKASCAKVIDDIMNERSKIEYPKKSGEGEKVEWLDAAKVKILEAQMLVVKAITFK